MWKSGIFVKILVFRENRGFLRTSWIFVKIRIFAKIRIFVKISDLGENLNGFQIHFTILTFGDLNSERSRQISNVTTFPCLNLQSFEHCNVWTFPGWNVRTFECLNVWMFKSSNVGTLESLVFKSSIIRMLQRPNVG